MVAGEAPSLDLAMKIAGLTGNQVRPQDFKEIPMTKTLDTVEEAIKAIETATTQPELRSIGKVAPRSGPNK